MKLFMGIDTGQKGAIAVIDEDSNIVLLEEFPDKGIVDVTQGWICALNLLGPTSIFCVKEEPIRNIRPGLGGTYSRGITIGQNIGLWEYWLELHNIKWIDKQPRTWQKIFPEFVSPGGKERSEAAAIREIPECKDRIYGPRGGLLDGRSDAILLSIFCKLLVDRGMFR